MSDTAKYEVRLEDGVSGPSKSASQALANLRQGLDRSTAELGQMNKAMREMKAAGLQGSDSFKKLEAQIKGKIETVGQYRDKYIELGGTFRKVKPPTKELSAFAAAAEKVPGPLGSIAGRMAGLSKFAVGGIVAAGIFAIGAALVGLATAAAAAGVALVSYGIQQADARRNETLRLEGLTRLRRGMHATGESASAMQAAIDRVSDSSSASRSTLEGYSARLHRLGLRGDNFTAALEGMAIRGEVLGDRYAQSFAGMAAAAARSGRSVRGLANAVQERLGDIAGRKLLALGVTMEKFRDNLGSLFRNVKIEGFLRLFREFASTFSQARVTGRALAGIMERLFGPLDAGAERSVGTVRRFFTVMITNILRIENAFLELKVRSLETWAALNERGITVLRTMNAIRSAISLWGDAIALPFTAASAVARGLVHIMDVVRNAGAIAGERFRKAWQGLDLRSIGRNMIAGLVTSIISGTVQVVGAVTTLAQATTGALREALQIKSPSRVFAALGKEIPRGLAMGIEAGADQASGAIDAMLNGAAGGDVSVTGKGSLAGRTAISIESLNVYSAATDAAGIAQDIMRQLAEGLEGVVIMSGEVPA